MTHPPRPRDDDERLEASLQPLGIHELEERLELAPLVADAGLEGADGCRCSCECDFDPDDPIFLQDVPDPDHGGFGLLHGPRI